MNNVLEKLIECQTCFRTFITQAQFGQHSRICGKTTGSVSQRKFVPAYEQSYKYSYLEKQIKNKLEIKSRFILNILTNIKWKTFSKETNLTDAGIKQLLKINNLNIVHATIRNRIESGLIVASFSIRNVQQTPNDIHKSKIQIQNAVNIVMNKINKLTHITMKQHLCHINNCKELVIRDTEGYCSRHRAKKYHKKTKNNPKNITQKRKFIDNDNMILPSSKRLKISNLISIPPKLNKMKSKSSKSVSNNNTNSIQSSDLADKEHVQQKRRINIQKEVISDRSSCNLITSSKLSSFLSSNTYIMEVPINLYGVRISKSLFRQNGINILSIDYSIQLPNPQQVLRKDNKLIVFASRNDISSYKYNNNINCFGPLSLLKNTNNDRIRFTNFCENLIKHYVAYIPVPQYLIGRTLNEIPELSQYGVKVIAINLTIQHPFKMRNKAFNKNDLLLCCFDTANDKLNKLYMTLKQVKMQRVYDK